jgi:hypothetical protein
MAQGSFPKIISVLLLLASSFSFGATQLQTTANGTRYRFEIDRVLLDPVRLYGEPFVRVRLEGVDGYEGLVAEPGYPEMPAIRFYVDGPGTVVVEPGAVDRPWNAASALRVKPFQPSRAKSHPEVEGLRLDRAAYASTELYPATSFDIETVGTVNGVERRLVSLYPIRYEAAANRFETIRKFEVRVAVKSPARAPAAPALALVTAPEFSGSPALQQYADFKKSQGFSIVRLEYGRDAKTPVELRGALKTLSKQGGLSLQEAMIVGDNGQVPGYETPLLEGVTDHYYRCLDGVTYDSDIGTPDIEVGRFAVASEAELEAVVKKQIRYEQGNFADKSWINRFSLIATDDSSNYPIAEASFDYLTDKYTTPLGYLGSFPKNPQTGGDLLYAIRHSANSSQVVERMKEGRGFINYGGHGNEDSWDGPEVTADDVHAITHADATPFVMSNSCLTGKFTVDSFAETWQRHPQGSIAFWGSMDSTYWDEDDVLQRKVYDVMFRDKSLRLASFTDAGLAEVWRYYGGKGRSKYYWETYVVFGDPSTTIRLNP